MELQKQNQISELKKAMKGTKNNRLRDRYQSVYLHLSGYTMTEIAQIVGHTRKTIGSYVAAYREGGIEALTPRHSQGRPRRLSKKQEAELKEIVLAKLPSEVGFDGHSNWTLAFMVLLVEQKWGISYSLKGMSLIMERLGLSRTRPPYTLANADPEKQRKFREETFPSIKKLIVGEIDHVLFQDESMIRDYQAIQKTWFLKGKQRKIPTHGKHRGAKLIGCLNYETGEILCQEKETYDAVAFQEFLLHVLNHYPEGKIVIILDNARIHHAKLLTPFLRKHQKRIELVFLPPYSPELNLMEGVWKWLKETVINNIFFPNVQKIILAVRSFLNWISQQRGTVIDRLCVRM